MRGHASGWHGPAIPHEISPVTNLLFRMPNPIWLMQTPMVKAFRTSAAMAVTVLLVAASGRATAQSSEHHSSGDLNRAVPDGSLAGLSDTRTITSAIKKITAVKVQLSIAGQFNGDLYAYLRQINAQATNFCVLLNRPGRCATNGVGYADAGLNITLDSGAADDIHLYRRTDTPSADTPLTGTWQPDGRTADPAAALDTSSRLSSLTNFAGKDGSGEWTLFVADLESGGTNLLVSWDLEIIGGAVAPVSWPTPADIVYGTALGGTQLNASAGGVAGTFAYTPPEGSVLKAGSNQLLSAVFTPTDSNTYLAVTNTVRLTVLKAPLTITASSTNKVYGAPLPAMAVTYNGFVNSETNTSLDAQVLLSTSATAASPSGAYPITASGAGSTNYAISYVAGTLDITRAGMTGTLASSKNPALPGEVVALTFTATATPPGAGTPTGLVQFKIDGTNAGASVTLSSSVATYGTSSLTHGAHTVTAEYAGDGNFTGTTNNLSSAQVVNRLPVAGPDTIERNPSNGVKVAIATLLSNDGDADGDTITFVSVNPASSNGGTAWVSGDWAFYQPPAGFTNVDSFTYTITDGYGVTATGTVTVRPNPAQGQALNMTIGVLGGGAFCLTFNGVPGRACFVEYSTTLNPPNWQPLANGTNDSVGVFEWTDSPSGGTTSRYYRSVYR
jgi:subtilisin-like proprotein convertase family protein